MSGDPFAAMAAALTAAAPPPLSRAEATARRLGRAAELLRASGDQAGLEVAEAIDRWLVEGGDLAQLLGARARRGRRRDLPATDARMQARDDAIRSLAARACAGSAASARAHFLAAFLQTPSAKAIITRECGGAAYVPTSHRQLVRIIRAGPDMK